MRRERVLEPERVGRLFWEVPQVLRRVLSRHFL